MKSITLITGLVASLLIAQGCASTGNSNNTSNTTTTTTNRSTTSANTTNTNAANTNAANSGATATNTNSQSSANASGGGTAANEGGAQDFTMVNATGVEINSVYIAPHDVDDWEEDILGRDTLPPGETVDIKFNRSEKAAMWDLKVEDKQGNSITWENLNLMEISKLTLHYENGKATAEAQ